jgi:hypothetical protein
LTHLAADKVVEIGIDSEVERNNNQYEIDMHTTEEIKYYARALK